MCGPPSCGPLVTEKGDDPKGRSFSVAAIVVLKQRLNSYSVAAQTLIPLVERSLLYSVRQIALGLSSCPRGQI